MTPAPSTPSDEALLRSFRNGDRGAFDELVRRHHGPVYAIAYARLANREAAEDLAQEIFLRAFVQHHALRDGSRFPAWVCNMARNLAIDWIRRGETRSRLIPLIPLEDAEMAQVPEPHQPRADELMEQEEERLMANEAIRNLPPEQRELILLHFSEGMSRSDIARQLGVHPSTVGRQLDAAIAAMRKNVEEGLRKSAPALRPRKLAPARTLAMVSAFVALAPEAKAAVAHAATDAVAVSSQATGGTTLLGTLKAYFTLLTGGATLVGTTKLILGGAALVATILGITYVATSAPSHDPPPAPTPQEITGSYDLTLGQETVIPMQFGRAYRISFPTSNPIGLISETVSVGADGSVRTTTDNIHGQQWGEFILAPGNSRVFAMNTPYLEPLGCILLTVNKEGAEVRYWFDVRKEHVPAVKKLAEDYLHGKISTKQYRQRYAEELKKRGLGPRDDAFRVKYYEELTRQAEVPTSFPQPLPESK